MTYAEMKRILLYCRVLGYEGLKNGNYANIPELKINLPQKNSFIGKPGNPAIFVTEITYKKLSRFHEDWVPNVTIAISDAYLLQPRETCIDVIGVLVHEAGHAFNVYAKIPNTEANAYVFEIETMLKLFKMAVLSRQFDISKADVRSYFQSRMDQYSLEIHNNPYLKTLVEDITKTFQLKNTDINPERPVMVQIKLGFFKQDNKSEMCPEKELSNQRNMS